VISPSDLIAPRLAPAHVRRSLVAEDLLDAAAISECRHDPKGGLRQRDEAAFQFHSAALAAPTPDERARLLERERLVTTDNERIRRALSGERPALEKGGH
jgi:hypothetical protein